ncbi:MAG: hypothetical protein WC475_03485 [Candidatus Paceibacterota bacterium]
MAKKELVGFLKKAKSLKLDLEAIGRELVKAGWNIEDVGNAIEDVKGLKESKDLKFKAPKPVFKAPAFPGK